MIEPQEKVLVWVVVVFLVVVAVTLLTLTVFMWRAMS